MSRASTAINLSQPATSQAIASLERRFGVPLLERHPSGSLPTQYGEILLFRIRRFQNLMLQGIEEFAANASAGHKLDVETTLGKVTLTQIRSLIAVSENISFDQASRSIGISQSSLHRSARELEKLLRRPLYARGARGTTTTRHGNVLARRFNVALGEIRYAREEIEHQKGLVDASLVVGTLSTLGAPLLGRAINRLLTEYPGLTVRVIEEPYDHLLHDLLMGKMDFVFGVLRRPEWASEIVEETLYRDDYVVVCRPGHPLTRIKSLSLNDLARYNWIVPGPDTPRFRGFKGLFANSRMPTADVVTTSSRAIIRAVIAGSDRLSLIRRNEALSEQSLGAVSILPFQCNMPAPPVGVAARAGWAPTTTQKRFLDILRSMAAGIGGLPEHAPPARPSKTKSAVKM